jgi:hypothetical protein
MGCATSSMHKCAANWMSHKLHLPDLPSRTGQSASSLSQSVNLTALLELWRQTGPSAAAAHPVWPVPHVQVLRTTTHALDLTTLIALLQPPPEVFELFDDLLLMSDQGGVLYHGPVAGAVPFFDRLGLRCGACRWHPECPQLLCTCCRCPRRARV